MVRISRSQIASKLFSILVATTFPAKDDCCYHDNDHEANKEHFCHHDARRMLKASDFCYHNDDKVGQVPGFEEGAEQLPEGGRGVGQGRQ